MAERVAGSVLGSVPGSAVDELSPTKRALLAIKDLQAKLDAVQREPIAIVGMSGRLPGKVDSPESFWDFLLQKGDAIAPIPKDRWDASQYHDPNNNTPGKMPRQFVDGHKHTHVLPVELKFQPNFDKNNFSFAI